MIAYASRTGTRRNLAALRKAGWRLLVSATGALRPEGFRYALDNGAWTAHQRGEPFDGRKFSRALDLLGAGADWVVVPDVVGNAVATIEMTKQWIGRCRSSTSLCLVAVQDGMFPQDVEPYLRDGCGIFVGGSTGWKLKTMALWGHLASEIPCWLHIGRVNTARRIAHCASVRATSFDGTSASRYAETLPLLDSARRQTHLVF